MNKQTDDFLGNFFDPSKFGSNEIPENPFEGLEQKSPIFTLNDPINNFDLSSLTNFNLSPQLEPTKFTAQQNTMSDFPQFPGFQVSDLGYFSQMPVQQNQPTTNFDLYSNQRPSFYDYSASAPNVQPLASEYDIIKTSRLKKNRESARQSRNRKKEYVETLKEKYSGLRPYLNKMRKETLEGISKQISKTMFSNQVSEGIREKIRLLELLLDMFFDTFFPYYTKFHICMCFQPPDFFQTGCQVTAGELNIKKEVQYERPILSENDLWGKIVSNLLLTNEQELKLRSSFQNNKKRDIFKLSNYANIFKQLKMEFAQIHKAFLTDFDEVHSILKPHQSKILHKFLKSHISQIHKYIN